MIIENLRNASFKIRLPILVGVMSLVAAGCGGGGGGSGTETTGITAPPIARSGEAKASSYGFYTKISLFDGPVGEKGPAPTVSLPPAGAASPLIRNTASGQAQYGPASIFESGPISVRASGTKGPNGTVNSSASVTGIPEGPSPFFYRKVTSTCRAAKPGLTGSAVIEGGILDTKYDAQTREAVEKVAIPKAPPPNTERQGTLDHVGDTYRVVFNEQVKNPDGSLTVNAVHMYLLGPAAKGDLIIGESTCA